MRLLQNKKIKIFLVILLLLLLVRITMPYILLHYVENRINKIPEYQVAIKDLDVHLLKGSYVIKGIKLEKIKANIPVPFFSASRLELAIEWKALLRGSFVAQINIMQPQLNFVIDDNSNNQQLTMSEEWLQAVKALFPLNFNHISLQKGLISFRSYTGKPSFNIFMHDVNAELNNLRNVDKSPRNLPSSLEVNAQTMDGAPFYFKMDFNPFANTPTFKMIAELKQMKVPAANAFLRHYTKLDIKQGLFSLYVEAAATKGKITGYAKPLIKNLQVVESKNDISPVEALYKGAVQLVAKVLENPRTKNVATKIEISGDINNPDISIWSIISNLLRNVFIQALLPQVDHTVKMKDINLNNQ